MVPKKGNADSASSKQGQRRGDRLKVLAVSWQDFIVGCKSEEGRRIGAVENTMEKDD